MNTLEDSVPDDAIAEIPGQFLKSILNERRDVLAALADCASMAMAARQVVRAELECTDGLEHAELEEKEVGDSLSVRLKCGCVRCRLDVMLTGIMMPTEEWDTAALDGPVLASYRRAEQPDGEPL